ncbi:hypothetical protein BTVI_130409 [Pitangus sulphuratus]|nr:hypothetical protein BTVI_130409 [Pitangus sulphuratus]
MPDLSTSAHVATRRRISTGPLLETFERPSPQEIEDTDLNFIFLIICVIALWCGGAETSDLDFGGFWSTVTVIITVGETLQNILQVEDDNSEVSCFTGNLAWYLQTEKELKNFCKDEKRIRYEKKRDIEDKIEMLQATNKATVALNTANRSKE